jgi:hypothetical protein
MNPFLTKAVDDACNDAVALYLDLLDRKQIHGGTPLNVLSDSKAYHEANLNQAWEAACNSATLGDIQSATLQFVAIIKQWALFKAYLDLIDNYAGYLDPADPDIENDFILVLEAKVAYLATELVNKRTEGAQERRNNQANVYLDRQQRLYGVYDQMSQRLGQALDQAHGYNIRYAEKALEGSEQAQETARSFMDKAGEMYGDVQESMQAGLELQRATIQHVEQHLPREMERAQARAQRKSCLTQGCIVLVLVFAGLMTFPLAFLILQHIVLH